MINQKYSVLAKYAKDLASKSAALPGNEILDMGSVSGVAADYLTPTHRWGGRRAGRATAMGDAADADVPLNVRHPLSASLMAAIPAGILGGVGGASLGHMLSNKPDFSAVQTAHDALANAKNINAINDRLKEFGTATTKYTDDIRRSGQNIVTGMVLGGVGLSVGASVLMSALRRRQMKNIQQKYDQAREQGTLNPQAPEFSTAATLLAPFRGPHRKGMMQGYNAIKNDVKPHNSVRSTAGYLIPGGDNATGLFENISAQGAARQAKDVEKASRKPAKSESKDKSDKKEDGKKEASFSKALDLLLLDLRR